MTRPEQDPLPGALDALVAVTSVPETPGRADLTLREYLTRILAAAEGRAAALWVPETLEDQGPTVTLVGCPSGAGAALSTLFAQVAPPEIETGVDLLDDHPYGPLLGAMGITRARLVPLPVGSVVAGVCVVGYDTAAHVALHPARAHAVRVGVRLAGRVIEAVRLRGNLERAMAQILLTDERMLGRMGLDIHDGPTQQLSVALLEVQLLEAELSDAEQAGRAAPASLRPALERIYETVGGALHEMRELIGHLRPAQFEDRRLTEILGDAIAGFEKRTDCAVVAEWDGEFLVNGVSITQRITLYRILQEALTNAHRHGGAHTVRVRVCENDSGITLLVRDDGIGFDAEAAQRRRPGAPQTRFGLHGMRDRARLLGGDFAVESAAGRGTSVKVFLPRWTAIAEGSTGVS